MSRRGVGLFHFLTNCQRVLKALTACLLVAQTFMEITRGLQWPAGPTGGALRVARHMRVLDKPTPGDYTTMVVMDHAPLPSLPGPITSDTQARPRRLSRLGFLWIVAHARAGRMLDKPTLCDSTTMVAMEPCAAAGAAGAHSISVAARRHKHFRAFGVLSACTCWQKAEREETRTLGRERQC